MDSVVSAKLTTLVDNLATLPYLTSSWGISLLVEVYGEKGHTILMDTGESFDILRSNASMLNADLSSIEAIFISHWHWDHCGALSALLRALENGIHVYVPSREASAIREIEKVGGIPEVCDEPTTIFNGVMSTGSMGAFTKEHSMLVNVKGKGLVILLGCSHPGVATIVGRSCQVSRVFDVYAVVGGLHISGFQEGAQTASLLRDLDVKFISPCHCTGLYAKKAIRDVFGRGFIKNGSGTVISISDNRGEQI